MWAKVEVFIEHNRPLISAITQVECGGDIFAARVENGYSYLWDVRMDKPRRCEGIYRPNDFLGIANTTSHQTEFIQQRTSWGPMQVMGAVAREYGFKGSFAALCGELGMKYGALHLMRLKKRLIKKGLDREDDLIAAYNAGWARRGEDGAYLNQRYVDKVNAVLAVVA